MSNKLLHLLKKYRLTVNPQSIESSIYTNTYRKQAPASQPQYTPPQTDENTKIADNYYFQRDHRRQYPQTITVTNNTTTFSLPNQQQQPTLPVTSTNIPNAILNTTNNAQDPKPPSISNKHLNWIEADESNLPSFSPTVYFQVKSYK